MNEVRTQPAPAETVTEALGISGAQPAWMTLDEARAHSFTGEIVFEVEPEVLAYLDNGVVYYAERDTDAPLGRRLVEAGVLADDQLDRGIVRVGDLEHLGRLFDRDASVDRDAVMVATETSTEDLLTDLANHAVTTVRLTAYRHHPSGVHRWFAPPPEPAHLVAPVVEPPPTVASAPFTGAEDLTIEWDRFDDEALHNDSLPAFEQFELVMFDPFRDGADPSADLSVTSVTDLASARPSGTAGNSIDGSIDGDLQMTWFEDDLADFQFEVTWPDGSEQPVSLHDDDDAGAAHDEDAVAFTENADGDLHFEMPPLVLSDDETAADEVPDEVADAVRRAIAAIEAAAVMPIESAVDIDTSSDIGTIAGTDVAELGVPTETAAPADAAPVTNERAAQAAPLAPSGNVFAPPTLDMSAEAVYARMEADMEAGIDSGIDSVVQEQAEPGTTLDEVPAAGGAEAVPTLGAVAPESLVAPADEPVDELADRSSALRRLIGSLRRKDR
jgi:hypothetical protein